MKKTNVLAVLVMVSGLTACLTNISKAAPIGNAFTYQGFLMEEKAGSPKPSNGEYDFVFSLYDNRNVIDANAVGSSIIVEDVTVVDGSFTTELDFGSGTFAGDARWMEIAVRPGASTDYNDFTYLSPLVELTPVPYAIYASAAEDADTIDGLDSSDFALISHNHDGVYALPGHLHDDRYYTKTELQTDGSANVHWKNLFGVPADIADGDDAGDTDWTEAGSNVYRVSGNIGIGTSNPDEKLHVAGSIKIADGTQGANKVLTSNASGVASWQEPQVPSGACIPVGGIIMWSGSSIPTGWALCDGNNGTPDLRNRFIVGAGDTYSIGNKGGESSHTLTIAEMPSHSHSAPVISGQPGAGDGSGYDDKKVQKNLGSTSSNGNGQPHENRPPYFALAYIMKK